MEYAAIGIMSGSSLDGLDLAFCRFNKAKTWQFRLIESATFELPNDLRAELASAEQLDSRTLLKLDWDYGRWIADQVSDFLSGSNLSADILGIHGHTVFHEPAHGLSLQLGNGRVISQTLKLPVVDNFRIQDILMGGQGAPLVPVGELNLFQGIDAFINLGGIANVTIPKPELKAWDIAPCNQVFNFLANQLGSSFDPEGSLARKGTIDPSLFKELSALDYFHLPPPKSLSNQWTKNVLAILSETDPVDALSTYVEFLAYQLLASTQMLHENALVMVTGGGARNDFLLERVKANNTKMLNFQVPDVHIVDYKEAIIFGFLALLRFLNLPNCRASVTGAMVDSVGGDLHHSFSF